MPHLDGDKVRRLRRQAGLSQEKLAEKAGLHSLNTILAAEQGRNVSPTTHQLLAAYFKVKPEELLPPPPPQVWISDLPRPGSSVFVGREDELAQLDKAWDSGTCHIVTVVGGWGGGKSTLIHHWLKRMSVANYRGAER